MSRYDTYDERWEYGITDHDAAVVNLDATRSLWVVKHGAWSWCNVVTHDQTDLVLGNWQWWPQIMDISNTHKHVPAMCKIDAGHVLGMFNDDYASYVQALSITGTTVTGGERVQVALKTGGSQQVDSTHSYLLTLEDGRGLLIYDDQPVAEPGNQRIKGRLISVSGTDVSVGAAQEMDTTPFDGNANFVGSRHIWAAAGGGGVLVGLGHYYDNGWHGWLRWYTVDGDTIVLHDSLELYGPVNQGNNVKVAHLEGLNFVAQASYGSGTFAKWQYVSVVGNVINVGPVLGPLVDPADTSFELQAWGYANLIPDNGGFVTILGGSDGDIGVYSMNVGYGSIQIARAWIHGDTSTVPRDWIDLTNADPGFALVTWVYSEGTGTNASARIGRVGVSAGPAGGANARSIRLFGREKTKRAKEYSG